MEGCSAKGKGEEGEGEKGEDCQYTIDRYNRPLRYLMQY